MIEEKYIRRGLQPESFVSLNTEAEGVVSVKIIPDVRGAVESIDLLVQPGTRMKVRGPERMVGGSGQASAGPTTFSQTCLFSSGLLLPVTTATSMSERLVKPPAA